MNKLLIFSSLAVLIGLASCKKCTDCSCVSTTVYEFEDGFDPATQSSIEGQYNKEFEEDYPDYSEEICAKRGQFSDTTSAFEAQTYTFTDGGKIDGLDWSVDFEHICTCAE